MTMNSSKLYTIAIRSLKEAVILCKQLELMVKNKKSNSAKMKIKKLLPLIREYSTEFALHEDKQEFDKLKTKIDKFRKDFDKIKESCFRINYGKYYNEAVSELKDNCCN